jgi:membrane-associated phospholipid phosphatase
MRPSLAASALFLTAPLAAQHPSVTTGDTLTRSRPDSTPSGHVTHISSIAAAVAEEAQTPWVTTLCATAVTLTGWQRVYADQHWMSDVVAGAIVGTAASRLTAHWLRHKVARPRPDRMPRADSPQ